MNFMDLVERTKKGEKHWEKNKAVTNPKNDDSEPHLEENRKHI
tara:strand:- start:674 stop:802 length:129 start_codon:yes stop_codon:yes gene_type:complete